MWRNSTANIYMTTAKQDFVSAIGIFLNNIRSNVIPVWLGGFQLTLRQFNILKLLPVLETFQRAELKPKTKTKYCRNWILTLKTIFFFPSHRRPTQIFAFSRKQKETLHREVLTTVLMEKHLLTFNLRYIHCFCLYRFPEKTCNSEAISIISPSIPCETEIPLQRERYSINQIWFKIYCDSINLLKSFLDQAPCLNANSAKIIVPSLPSLHRWLIFF